MCAHPRRHRHARSPCSPFRAVAAADDAIVVKRVPGLDRAERADLRADAGVRLEATLPLRDTELVVAEGRRRRGCDRRARGRRRRRLRRAGRSPSPRPRATRSSPASGACRTPGRRSSARRVPRTPTSTRRRPGRSRAAPARPSRSSTPGSSSAHPDLDGQIWSNPGESGGGRETNGVDDDHNGLVDDWRGWDFVNGDNTHRDRRATSTARTSRARSRRATDNGIGVAGVAPDAKLLPVKIFGAPGSMASSSSIAMAFDYAGSLGVDVVNASLGGSGTSQLDHRRR